MHPGHRRATNENRNDPRRRARQSGPDLVPHEIFWVIDAAFTIRVRGREPAPPNEHHENVALRDAGLDDLEEVLARLDVIDVHEQPVITERRLQAIVEPSSVWRGVLTPVADENLSHVRQESNTSSFWRGPGVPAPGSAP